MLPSDESSKRALVISGWLTGIYFFIELTIGFRTGSISVISDAFHTFSAVGGVLIALVAGNFATRRANRFQSFGLIRAEIIGAFFNGLFLFGMAIFVFWMGYKRLKNPIELSTTPMLLAALGGLITETISLKLLYGEQKNNLNIKGAFWHIMQTFVGSLIIIVVALVIRFTGFLTIDPLLGMAFGLVLFWASWGIIKDALHILLNNVPKTLDLNGIKNAINKLPNVKNVHHLHAWSLTVGKDIISAHVLITDNSKSDQIQNKIHNLLKKDFGIYFSTIQTETKCLGGKDADAVDFV